MAPKIISQGNTAEIFEYDDGRVVKLYRSGLVDALCQHEYTVGCKVYAKTKMCPQVFEIVRIDGRSGIVFEKIDGPTMLKRIYKNIWLLKSESRKMGQYHIAVHQEIDGLTSVKDKLTTDIQAVEALTKKEKAILIDYLTTLPDGNALCHFDFHPDNIMYKYGSPVIIDWMTACSGDALSDVARTGIILKYAVVPRVPSLVAKVISLFQNKVYEYYLKEYLRLSNCKIENVKRWELPIMAARLREWVSDEEKAVLLTLVRQKITAF